MRTFDLVVVGTGSAGSTIAYRCRKAGWSVAIIDELPFGGTCALRGCDPKKVLVGAADLVDWSHRMRRNGISGNLEIDWPALMRFKRRFTDPVSESRAAAYEEAGITAVQGTARFIDTATLEVRGEKFSGRHIVIASGATPRRLDIPGEDHLTTSSAFLELEELPRRIIFIGGGYISLELAHVARRAGAEVVILHRGSRLLQGFDPDLVATLTDATKDIGIDLRLSTTVEAIEKDALGFVASVSAADGTEESFSGDMIVHGAGRVPALEGLDLEMAGISHDKRGIAVNEYLQSVSNSALYAAGDVVLRAGGLPLTPVAGYEGQVVASNLLQGNHAVPDYTGLPSVVFTIPPLAMVGWHEEAARKENLSFRVVQQGTADWYSSRRVAENHSAFKVLVEEGSERILGAHLLGQHAEDTINLFALAFRHKLTAADFKQMLWAYPTHASDVNYMV